MKRMVYLLLMLLPVNVFAAPAITTTKKAKVVNDFIFTCDKNDKIHVSEQIVCRISVKSNFYFNEIGFTIPQIEGFEITDIRSNSSKVWNIIKNNNEIKATSEEVQTDLQEFGIMLLKATKSGSFDINIDNINLVNTLLNDNKSLNSVKQNLKVVSTDNLLKNIYINDEALKDFSSSATTYDYYIDNEETIKIAVESNNEFATIKGAGEYNIGLKEEKTIIPITVLSEDGTSRIYILNIIRKDFNKNNIDKSLDSIIVKNDKGNTLLIGFKEDIYEYNFDVDINTLSLEVNPTLKNENITFIKGYGKQQVDLKPGNNIILIKVQDNEGETLNYILNVTKPIANKSDNNFIKSLEIKHHNISFSKRVKNYTLEIEKNENKLEIIPILENENATFSIIGNNNLKEGSIIKIVVTAENEEKTVYKINIKTKKTSYTKYVIWIIIAIVLVYVETKYQNEIVKLFKKKKNKKPVRRKVTNIKPVIKKTKKKSKSKTTKSTNKKSSSKKTNNKTKTSNNNKKSTPKNKINENKETKNKK